jgi:hypothetical protein
MKLVYSGSRREVKVGDLAQTFRGEFVEVVSIEKPRHAGSTGRVYVKFDGSSGSREFFPGVIDAKWVESEAV